MREEIEVVKRSRQEIIEIRSGLLYTCIRRSQIIRLNFSSRRCFVFSRESVILDADEKRQKFGEEAIDDKEGEKETERKKVLGFNTDPIYLVYLVMRRRTVHVKRRT